MKIFIQRGGRDFGPYAPGQIGDCLKQGRIFLHDLAREEAAGPEPGLTLRQLLLRSGHANLVQAPWWGEQARVNWELLWPWTEMRSLNWLSDRRLLGLAAIGLTPAVALAVSRGGAASYWAIALYFSALWALFFFSLFKTPQVKAPLGFLCFFWTGLVSIPVLLVLQRLPLLAQLHELAEAAGFLPRFVGMLFGVGVIEELTKAAVVLWLVRRPGDILLPQTVVLYGMISGLGFGIYEGVAYQQSVNREQGVDAAYFLNIARLTSLPFLHAIWTGIAGYFIGFSALFPMRRHGLRLCAIGVPACLHALYNTFGWSLPGLAAGLLGVVLLMTYLANCRRTQQQLQL